MDENHRGHDRHGRHHHQHHHRHHHGPSPVDHLRDFAFEMMGRGHRHGGPGGFGPPPPPPGGFGPPPPPPGFGWGGFPWSFFRGNGGGRRARRGDVRGAILALLAEQPRNGYQMMQELEERSRGYWRPSPGSIYPALSQLEDEGLIKSENVGAGKVFELTDRGREYVKEHADELRTPWEEAGSEDQGDIADLMKQLGPLSAALAQVARSGNPAQIARAKKIVSTARRELYGLLAAEDAEDDEE